MTREDILAELRETRPNEYQDEWAMKRIDELRQRIIRELLEGYIVPDEGGDLLTPTPYHQLYLYWLYVQIDLANGEYDRYNNDLALFTSAWDEYGRYISRTMTRSKPEGFRLCSFPCCRA